MLGMTWGHATKCFAFLGLATLAAADARAGYTHVDLTPAAPAWGHAAILSNAYGGTFAADGLDLTNGTLTARRQADFGDGASPAPFWGDGIVSARLLARSAGDDRDIDLLGGEGGAAFRELLAASNAAALNLTGENGNAADPVVSYRLNGPDGGRTFVLFFEDVNSADGGDRAYNDLVVEVTAAAAPAPAAIPLPPAVWSGLLVLLTSGLLNARSGLQRWLTA